MMHSFYNSSHFHFSVSSTTVNQTVEYGSEWDTDGEAYIAQQKREAAKKRQTIKQRNARQRIKENDDAATKPSSTAPISTTIVTAEQLADALKNAKNGHAASPNNSNAQPDVNDRSTATKVKQRKRAHTIASDDSDDDQFVKKQPKPSKSSATRRQETPKPTKTQNTDGENANSNRAQIQLTKQPISFLGTKFEKTVKRFVCPVKTCRVNYSSFLNLKNHFTDVHNRNLERSIDSDENNWRRIQNANSRFEVTTIKQKLRSLLIDGKTPIKNQPIAASLAKQKTEVATKLCEIMNNQAI